MRASASEPAGGDPVGVRASASEPAGGDPVGVRASASEPAGPAGDEVPAGTIAEETGSPGGDDRRPDARPPWRPLAMVLALTVAALAAIVVVALRPFDRSDPAGTAPAGSPPLLRDGGLDGPLPLPDMRLPALAGYGPAGGRDFSGLRGPAVINFWASWCVPCVEEMPSLQRVADDTDVQVIGVDYIDQTDKATDLAERLGIEYELVRDDDGAFGQAVGLMGTPTTLLVDDRGMIVRRLTGELTEQQMREAIAADLGRRPPSRGD